MTYVLLPIAIVGVCCMMVPKMGDHGKRWDKAVECGVINVKKDFS